MLCYSVLEKKLNELVRCPLVKDICSLKNIYKRSIHSATGKKNKYISSFKMSSSLRTCIDDIYKAHERIKPFVHKTEIFTSTTFNNLIGRNAFFKSENLQKTGSFKARGALNSVSNM